MKFFLLVLAALAVSLFGVSPARAETMSCDTPTIEALAQCVQHAADMGYITNAGIVDSLLAKTDAAQSALDHGNTAAAVRILNAFVLQVQAQSGVQIDAMHAEHMIMHARMVIAAISGSGM